LPESVSGGLPARPDQVKNDGRVRTLFSEIAPRYDLLNHVLSLNIDKRWRTAAIDLLLRKLGGRSEGRILDSCAGTYDLSLELVQRKEFQGKVVAADFAGPMLVAGLGKIEGEPVTPVCGDGLRFPFPKQTFQGAMVAFGVRNLADVDLGFREFHRVLDEGAPLVVLEFTTPPNALMRHLYLFYFHRILPIIGRIVSGHRWAYTYLPESVKDFPGPEALAEKLRAAGFGEVEWRYLTGGIAALHVGRKGLR
jgi:demethylmenaquinone methyltransferase/2-methoxy-6-polyprenyl-1,4-benzoquinol methylase